MATTLRSFCKINLGLAVGASRVDGFHGLTTCYQTLALHDRLTITANRAAKTEVTLEANHPGVPCSARGDAQRNTAHRMVVQALQRMGMSAKVHLNLEKRLPVQGGLGAGSANAATALVGLERELGISLPGPERLELAAEIGSDVPCFLLGGAVLGLERGERVFPLPDSPALAVVVAVPSVGVSTAQAFRDLDAQMARENGNQGPDPLTPTSPSGRLNKLSRVLASAWTQAGTRRETTGIAVHSSSALLTLDVPSDLGTTQQAAQGVGSDLAENPLLALVQTGIENDFESVAFRQHPSLKTIKRALEMALEPGTRGAEYAALSGSGSALFGIYRSAEAANQAQQRVQALGIRAFLTETLSRQEYWQQMFA